MRRVWNLATAICLTFATIVQAEEHKVVIELYTSQGCSSCPPADAYLAELAKRDDVIALALHVDYWDYIGWKDNFADPFYTQRQYSYARAAGKKMVYTPQMVIGGVDHVVGSKPNAVRQHISDHRAKRQTVELRAERREGQITVWANPAVRLNGSFVVELVSYSPEQTVDIKRGENAGRQISYINIVDDISTVGRWDGRSPLVISTPAPSTGPMVAIVQNVNAGPIVAAVQIN